MIDVRIDRRAEIVGVMKVPVQGVERRRWDIEATAEVDLS